MSSSRRARSKRKERQQSRQDQRRNDRPSTLDEIEHWEQANADDAMREMYGDDADYGDWGDR